MRDELLTQKQELFCLEYAKTGEPARAYMTAYNQKNIPAATSGANRLLNNPRVKQRLKELNHEVACEAIADIKEIKEKLSAILRQHATEEVLMTEGVEKGVTQTVRYMKKADLRTVTKAAELLAKMAGAFNDGNTVNVGVQVVVKDDLDD